MKKRNAFMSTMDNPIDKLKSGVPDLLQGPGFKTIKDLPGWKEVDEISDDDITAAAEYYDEHFTKSKCPKCGHRF